MCLTKISKGHVHVCLTTSALYCNISLQNARQTPITADIQRRYAHVVVDLDDVNKLLNSRLESIRTHCEALGLSSDVGTPDMSTVEHARKITAECNANLEATGRSARCM